MHLRREFFSTTVAEPTLSLLIIKLLVDGFANHTLIFRSRCAPGVGLMFRAIECKLGFLTHSAALPCSPLL